MLLRPVALTGCGNTRMYISQIPHGCVIAYDMCYAIRQTQP